MSGEGSTNAGETTTSTTTSTADTGGSTSSTSTTTSAGGGGGDGDSGSKVTASAFSVPDAYKDKPYAANIKSAEDLWKSYDNAQALIGKPKIGVPSEQATPEEKAAFYKEMGVPDDVKEYGFTKPEGLPDELWKQDNADKWAKVMKENNVPKSVAETLRLAMMEETLENHNAGVKALNEELTKAFGDKRLEVGKAAGDLMSKAIPDKALREKIQAAIGNENTPAFALALGYVQQYMKKTYGLSDTNTGGEGEESGGKTIPEMRAEAQKLMASPAYRDTMHKDHSDTRKQVDAMYKNIGVLTNQQQKK